MGSSDMNKGTDSHLSQSWSSPYQQVTLVEEQRWTQEEWDQWSRPRQPPRAPRQSLPGMEGWEKYVERRSTFLQVDPLPQVPPTAIRGAGGAASSGSPIPFSAVNVGSTGPTVSPAQGAPLANSGFSPTGAFVATVELPKDRTEKGTKISAHGRSPFASFSLLIPYIRGQDTFQHWCSTCENAAGSCRVYRIWLFQRSHSSPVRDIQGTIPSGGAISGYPPGNATP